MKREATEGGLNSRGASVAHYCLARAAASRAAVQRIAAPSCWRSDGDRRRTEASSRRRHQHTAPSPRSARLPRHAAAQMEMRREAADGGLESCRPSCGPPSGVLRTGGLRRLPKPSLEEGVPRRRRRLRLSGCELRRWWPRLRCRCGAQRVFGFGAQRVFGFAHAAFPA